ncbi:DUF6545 domain-containing protein [Streptomyces sp. NPDC002643]
MSDFVFHVSGGLLLLAGLLKLPSLVRARGRDPLLASICALLLGGGGVLLLTAEGAIIALREITGVTNLAVLLIYILLTVFSGASIVLVLHWRGDPRPARTRRLTRVTIVAYGVVCALIAVLFALGDTPVERRRDFDTYYATTPYIREMIVLYLVAHTVASATASRLCLRWSHEVRGTLRIGLRVLATGYLLHYGVYDPAVAAAVVARWAGADWDFLIAVAIGVTAPSAVLVAVGFLIPLAGRRGEDAVRYWRLGRLARAMEPVRGAAHPLPLSLPLSWKPDLRLRLTQRQTYIADRLVICRPHFDARVRDEAGRAALARGVTGVEAAAVADAVMVVTAVERQVAASAAGAKARRGAQGDEEDRVTVTIDLACVSRALRSPIVRDARSRSRSRSRAEYDRA